PVAAGKRNELHTATTRESLGHKSERTHRRGDTERAEVSKLVHDGTARLALFELIVGIVGNKKDVVRSKGHTGVIVLTNSRGGARVECRCPGKPRDMSVRVAG